ncbi:MAG: hypothetical protein II739_07825 [Clostridia bacterium]|nr:hypothetical protein [Clostridia bacterium]
MATGFAGFALFLSFAQKRQNALGKTDEIPMETHKGAFVHVVKSARSPAVEWAFLVEFGLRRGFFAKKVVTNAVFLDKMIVYFQRTDDG